MNETLFPVEAAKPRGAKREAAVTWPDWPFGDLEAGAYGLIEADPPWAYEMRGEGGYDKSPQAHYTCLDLASIKAMPVAKLAAPDCLLWLWTTWPFLASGAADQVVRAWGFEGRTGFPWKKLTSGGKTAFGPGYIVRGCTEPVILAVRGAPLYDKEFCARTRGLIEAEAREHSRKPEIAYTMAEKMVPNARRCRLFAREARPGWDVWGNETGKFGGAA